MYGYTYTGRACSTILDPSSCMVVFGLPVFRVERRQIEVRHNFRFLVSQKDQKLHLDSS